MEVDHGKIRETFNELRQKVRDASKSSPSVHYIDYVAFECALAALVNVMEEQERALAYRRLGETDLMRRLVSRDTQMDTSQADVALLKSQVAILEGRVSRLEEKGRKGR